MQTIQTNIFDETLIEEKSSLFAEEYKNKMLESLRTIKKFSTNKIGRKRQPEKRIYDSFGLKFDEPYAGADIDFLSDYFVASVWLTYRSRGMCIPSNIKKTLFLSYSDDSINILKDFFENPKHP